MKRWILAPITLGLFACSQHPDLYARYEPTGTDDVWVQGTRLHKASIPTDIPSGTPSGPKQGFGMEFTSGFVGKTLDLVQYDTTYGTPIRFSMKVENTGDSTFLLEPTRFRLWAAESSWAWQALDPEKVILAAERNMRLELDNHAASEGIESLISIPMRVATVIPSKTEQEAKAKSKYWKDKDEQDFRDEERHARALQEADVMRQSWSALSLRKSTIFPGKEVHGLISFIDDAPYRRPDSLEVQYEIAPGSFLNLGRYGKLVDSVAIARKQKAQEERKKRSANIHPY